MKSSAERVREHRERERRKELFLGMPADASCCRSLREYVKWHRAAATLEGERRGEDPFSLDERIARAEAYATKRWNGVQAGEVASL